MPNCFGSKKVKQKLVVKPNLVDDVDEAIANFARTSEDQSKTSRTLINLLLQLVEKAKFDDAVNVNGAFREINQLRGQFEEKEQELFVQTKTALECIWTLFEDKPIKKDEKKSRGSSYQRNDRRKIKVCLEQFGRRNPERPALRTLKETQDNAKGTDVNRLKQELEKSKTINAQLHNQLDGLRAENMRLKTKSSSQGTYGKGGHSSLVTKLPENEIQPLKIPIKLETIKDSHQQGDARQRRNDSYGSMDEFKMDNGKEVDRNSALIDERFRSNGKSQWKTKDVNNSHINGCITQEEYDGLKAILSKKEMAIEGNKRDIERIKKENAKLEDDLRGCEQKLAYVQKQHKEQIYQHEQEELRLNSELSSQMQENKELQHQFHSIEIELGMLKNSITSKRTSDKVTNDGNNIGVIKQENEQLRMEVEILQSEKSVLEAKLTKSQSDANEWYKLSQIEKDKSNQMKQEKATIEKKMNELRCGLKTKLDEASKLSTSLAEESGISRKLEEELKSLRQENDMLQKTLNTTRMEMVKLKEAFDDRLSQMKLDSDNKLKVLSNTHMKTLNDASQSEAKIKETITYLKEDVKTAAAYNSDLESQIQGHIQRNANLENEIHNELLQDKIVLQATLSSQKESFDEHISVLTHDKSILNEKLKNTKKNMKDLQATLSSQKETFDAKLSELDKDKMVLTERLKEMTNKMHDLQRTLSSHMETFNAKVSELNQDKMALSEKLKNETKYTHDLQDKLTSEREMLEEKVSDLTHNLKQHQARNSETEKILSLLKEEHLHLQQMYETAKEELDQFKSIKMIQIQFYHNGRVPLVSKVKNELKSRLRQEIENSTTKLEFIDCEKVTDVDSNIPLFIVCICVSRLGTDAASSIQSLKLTSNMALLVLHYKDGHALPNQASEHVLTGSEYKRLGGIFDFGFLSDRGMYSCELNDRNFRNIIHFINKEGVR